MTPFSQPYYEDGSLRRESNTGENNPLWEMENSDQEQDDEFINAAVFTNVSLMKGLSYRFSANIRSNQRDSYRYRNKLYPSLTGEGYITSWNRSSWLLDHVLNYELP